MENNIANQEIKFFRLGLDPKSIENANNIGKIIKTDNKANIVSRSLSLASEILLNLDSGGSFTLKTKDGEIYRLTKEDLGSL